MSKFSPMEMEMSLEKYHGKLNQQTRFENDFGIKYYYQDCLEESKNRLKFVDLNDTSKIMLYYRQLELDTRAVLTIMQHEITLLGCKELLVLCLQVIEISKKSSNKKEILDNFFTLISFLLGLINEPILENIYPYSDGPTEKSFFELTNSENLLNPCKARHFFNQFDFLCNLLLVEDSLITRAIAFKNIHEPLIEKGRLIELQKQYVTLSHLNAISPLKYQEYMNIINQYIEYYRFITKYTQI